MEHASAERGSARAEGTRRPGGVVPGTDGQHHLLRLQRSYGNAAVQRLFTPAVPSLAGKHTFAVKKEIPLKGSLGPLPATVTGLEVSAAGTFEGEPVNQAPRGTPSAKVGAIAGSETGVQVELEQTWEKGFIKDWTGMPLKVTEGGKFTTTGGEVGVEAALEGTYATFKVGVTFLEVKDGGLKLLTVKPGAEFPAFKKQIELPRLGIRGTLDVKTAVTVNIEPDYVKIARWLAERFGPELVVIAVPAAAGLAAAGFIGGTMYLMDDAHKRGVASGNAAAVAGQRASSFSRSFANVVTGAAPESGPGGDEGARAAEESFQKQVGIRDVMVEKNRQKGRDAIAREAYLVIAQRIYDDAKEQYRAKHQDDLLVGVGKFFGVKDFGSGLRSHLKPIAIVLENKQPGGPPLALAE